MAIISIRYFLVVHACGSLVDASKRDSEVGRTVVSPFDLPNSSGLVVAY